MNNKNWKNRLAMHLGVPAAIAFAAMTLPATSFAAPASMGRDLGGTVTRMVEGGRAIAPLAAVAFCMQRPDQCRNTGGSSIVSLDAGRKAQLISVNASVNRSIAPVNDAAGTDVWSVDVRQGDCEDYALTKRKQLISMGWPSKALRIAVAKTGTGEGHAVLVAKTSAGDYVLDNRTNKIKDWRSTDLRWVMIQSENNPKLWVDLGNRRQTPMMVSERDVTPSTADIVPTGRGQQVVYSDTPSGWNWR